VYKNDMKIDVGAVSPRTACRRNSTKVDKCLLTCSGGRLHIVLSISIQPERLNPRAP